MFAPLGAKLGAKRLVAAAERFGFNETPRVPAAKPSTIPSRTSRTRSRSARASIGQERDLATPLQMAAVGATIANRGVRPTPADRALRQGRPPPRGLRARSPRQVRDMMLGVVRGGHRHRRRAARRRRRRQDRHRRAAPDRRRPPDPKNTDAWFVAFAPAGSPKVAVAVMLVGAGQGGASAAPIARQVLQAAL